MDELAYLFSLEQFGIKFGLDNIRAIVERLGRPDRAFASIHVAGTNGKGSVTAMPVAAGAVTPREEQSFCFNASSSISPAIPPQMSQSRSSHQALRWL